ncbi:glycosyltransferase, partial [Escherichia coli]
EKKLGINSSDLVLLFVGQHIWQKNIKLLVDSLSYIKEQIPYKMFFVGDGYAKEELETYVKKLGLNDRVYFLGKILDRDYLRSLFARA